MIIYIDIFFVINFAFDFIIVAAADLFSKGKMLRYVACAFVGALYACLYVLPVRDLFFSLPSKIAVLVIMAAICEFPCTADILLKKTFIYCCISFFLCGTIYGISIFSKNAHFAPLSDFYLVGAIIFAVCTVKLFKMGYRKLFLENNCCVTIYYNNNHVCLSGIFDTGNTLTDLFTGFSAAVVDETALKGLFSPSFTRNNICEFVKSEDLRIIPYKTVSGNGVLLGFVPEKIMINKKLVNNMIIAVAPSSLEYEILVNPLSAVV